MSKEIIDTSDNIILIPTLYDFKIERDVLLQEKKRESSHKDGIRMNFIRNDSYVKRSKTKWCGFSFKP